MENENQNGERKLITADEFLKLLTDNTELEGYQINDHLLPEDSHISKIIDQLIFKNCRFKSIELIEYDIRIDVIFDNCIVEQLDLSRSDKENPDLLGLIIQNNSEIKKISLSSRSSFENVTISNSKIGNFESNFCKFLAINFTNVVFGDKLSFKHSKLPTLEIDMCNFKGNFEFSGLITLELTLRKCHYEEDFLFILEPKSSADSNSLGIDIESCKADNRMIFSGDNNTIHHLFLIDHIGLFEMYDISVKSTKIMGSFRKEGIYLFNNCSFNKFICTGINSPLKLSLIKSYDNQPIFNIRFSDLNRASFFNVNLQSFDSVIIEKSDFTNLITSHVIWFEDKQLKTDDQSELDDPHERREFYRQLKYNQEKQGNKIQALKFLSLEMEYYSRELAPKNNHIQNLLKYKTSGFFCYFILAFTSQNRFILWVGKSNNHGQNFLKPIIILIVLSFPFYWLILRTVYSNVDFASLQEDLTVWAQLLNPIHDVSKIFIGCNLYSPTHLLDLAWKIIEAILIFQTITAFRKYIRS